MLLHALMGPHTAQKDPRGDFSVSSAQGSEPDLQLLLPKSGFLKFSQ